MGCSRVSLGLQEAVPMVFCGLFPIEADQFPALREALEKLQLNDAALRVGPPTHPHPHMLF